MAALYVHINDREVQTVLQRLAAQFQPREMRGALLKIGERLKTSTTERFASATDPEGRPWEPLASDTMAARYQKMMREMQTKRAYRKKDGSLNKHGAAQMAKIQAASDKPLVATGLLSRSIRYQLMPGGAGVVIGANRQYAATHQFGSTIRAKSKKALAIPIADGSLRLVKSVTIPARPFLGLSADDKRTVLDILREQLAKISR
jgi:phage gpG-like protein